MTSPLPRLSPALSALYQPEEVLGVGGMGLVLRAVQRELDRPVALKLLRAPEPDQGWRDSTGDDAGVRLRDEATAAARLDHPDLVRVLDAGEDPEVGPWVVYELLPGPALDAALEAGPMPAQEVAERVAGPLLRGLEALHEAGVLHRDVKPGNLIAAEDGRFRLGDLGLARFTGKRSRTAEGLIVGTPGYVAPEKLEAPDAEDTPAGDLYAAAMVLAEALLGRHPLSESGASMIVAQLRTELDAPRLESLGLPASLAAPLAPALRRDPAERPGSAEELLAAFEQGLVSAGEPSSGRQRPASRPARSTRTRSIRPDGRGGEVTTERDVVPRSDRAGTRGRIRAGLLAGGLVAAGVVYLLVRPGISFREPPRPVVADLLADLEERREALAGRSAPEGRGELIRELAQLVASGGIPPERRERAFDLANRLVGELRRAFPEDGAGAEAHLNRELEAMRILVELQERSPRPLLDPSGGPDRSPAHSSWQFLASAPAALLEEPELGLLGAWSDLLRFEALRRQGHRELEEAGRRELAEVLGRTLPGSDRADQLRSHLGITGSPVSDPLPDLERWYMEWSPRLGELRRRMLQEEQTPLDPVSAGPLPETSWIREYRALLVRASSVMMLAAPSRETRRSLPSYPGVINHVRRVLRIMTSPLLEHRWTQLARGGAPEELYRRYTVALRQRVLSGRAVGDEVVDWTRIGGVSFGEARDAALPALRRDLSRVPWVEWEVALEVRKDDLTAVFPRDPRRAARAGLRRMARSEDYADPRWNREAMARMVRWLGDALPRPLPENLLEDSRVLAHRLRARGAVGPEEDRLGLVAALEGLQD